MTIDAFDLLKVIGKGSFGKVMLTQISLDLLALRDIDDLFFGFSGHASAQEGHFTDLCSQDNSESAHRLTL